LAGVTDGTVNNQRKNNVPSTMICLAELKMLLSFLWHYAILIHGTWTRLVI